jgi:hypothetical protein
MIDQVVNDLHTDESDDDGGEDIEGDWEPTYDNDDGDDEVPANEESRNVIRYISNQIKSNLFCQMNIT